MCSAHNIPLLLSSACILMTMLIHYILQLNIILSGDKHAS